MPDAETTCWTMIRGAAAGVEAERDRFVKRYGPVISAYLGARWKGTPLAGEADDAAQDVFFECFKDGGALERPDRVRRGFRGFLHGVVRNVASRYEGARKRSRESSAGSVVERQADDRELERVFDTAWARAMMACAGERQAERAESAGPAARRRVEVLRLRFQEGLAIREIAARWGVVADRVHEDYARARKEYERALREVVGFDFPNAGADVIESECKSLLALLRGE